MITETLFNAENITANSPQLEQLKQLFPNCFDTSGHFLLEKFQAEIAQHTDISHEFYSMNWLGKSYAKLLRNLPPETLLAEDVEHNSKEENAHSQNVLIQGDNLEVLKHLKNAYRNSVKMIYIDPPYNTGSDGFVYQDDRKFTPEQLATLANITQEEAERILNFTDKGSNSHSAWLTFMYPRLYVARELLKEDGVIFISIDDNEVAQLKLLCDEVFGEGNFLASIVWEKRFTRSNNSKTFATLVEHILCYRKSDRLDIIREPRNEKANSTFSNPDDDIRGVWTSVSYVNPATKEQRPNLHYPLQNPITNEIIIHPTHAWKYEKKVYESHLLEDKLYWGKDGQNKYPRLKLFLSELDDGMVPVNFWSRETTGTTDEASKSLQELMDTKVFDFPKPIGLILRILRIGTKSDDLILDFFAGSGTTAHAVMQLNAEDGGNRQFILVQLPEQTDPKSEAYKAGYKTIFEITKARIEKSAVKIREENPNASGDLGFKIYQTTDNFNAVAEDEFNPNQAQLPNLTSLTESQIQTLLTTWRVYDGAKLTEIVQAVDLGGYIAYLCDKRLYLLHEHFNSQHLLTFIQKLDNDTAFNPNRVIVFGNHMESAMQQELNQALTSYGNRKNISLSLIVRA
ncbi:site-specific DNA-methyltransferase [Basfia succiniciproducens]|uniref:site-specific DNA-methyltransferase n=1 Tax=Basfia succiniciproducens TaxID=653940 RepID=UPI003FCDC037